MVIEKAQDDRLKKFGINIKTKYKVGDKVLERNTDDSKNDTINSGIILEKDYYKGTLLKRENIFDSRILYTYDFHGEEDFTCKNCGMKGKVKEFENECPYCGTNYNIDYENKELGSKNYYDYVIKDKSYILKTYIIDFLVSLLIVSIYIIPNSRTLYLFDFLKVLVGTIIVSFILFFVFYYVDAFFLLPSLKRKKEESNERQKEFWKKMNDLGIDKVKFFNNINYELRELFYNGEENIIDFDVIDYDEFKDIKIDNDFYIDVLLDIRIVKYINGKVISKREEKKYRFKRLEKYDELKGGVNHRICPSCGSSIDVRDGECSYCGRKINYFQEWYLDNNVNKK